MLAHLDELCLDLAREHAPRAVLPPNLCQLLVVFEEEVQVLPGHVHIQVAAYN